MEEATKLFKQHTGFTQVSNSILNDKTLSLKAKGLYSYLFSKPDGWTFSAKRISKESRDGIDGIESCLRDLESAGYLSRKKEGTGGVKYYLKTRPFSGEKKSTSSEPNRENPCQGKTRIGCAIHIYNNNKYSPTEKTVKQKTTYTQESEEFILGKKMFKLIRNKVNRKFFANLNIIKKDSRGNDILDQSNIDQFIIGKWCDTFRKILTIDKVNFNDIDKVLDYIYDESDFWKVNILSPDKLRKQFQRLLIECEQKHPPLSKEELKWKYGSSFQG